MRVLVCGSRTFKDRVPIALVLGGYHRLYGDELVVIEGKAPGADSIAGKWAEAVLYDENHLEFPADWENRPRWLAGPERNTRMLVEGKPDVVWAFVDKDLADSKGTLNMTSQAFEAGVPVYVVRAHGAA
jgi:SLOG family YspA-like protein